MGPAAAMLSFGLDTYRSILRDVRDGVLLADGEGVVRELNPAASAVLGVSADEAVGQPLGELVRFPDGFAPWAREKTPEMSAVMRVNTAAGERSVEVAAGRADSGAYLIFRDVTDRLRAAETLAEGTRLLSLRADVASALAATQPKQAGLQACCEAVVRHLDVAFARIWTVEPSGEYLNLRGSAGLYTHLDGPHGRVPVGSYKIGRIARTGKPHLTNEVIGDPQIDRLWASREGLTAFAGLPLVVEGRVLGVLAVFARSALSETVLSDLAPLADAIAQYVERRRAEASLQESEQRFRQMCDAAETSNRRYRLLADAIRDVIMVIDTNGRGLYVSPSCERVLGYHPDEFLGQAFVHWIHPEDRERALAAMEGNRAGDESFVEWRCHRKDGAYLWMESVTSPFRGEGGGVVGFVCCTRDISRRKALEEQMRQAHKLEAVGLLAAGLSHDFNNLLTVIVGCGDLLRRAIGYAHPQSRLVDDILAAGERGAVLVRRLLAFGRQGGFADVRVFDPNDVLAEALALVGRLTGKDIDLRYCPGTGVGLLRADVGLYEQVLTNLVVNARDAMPSGGLLVVETSAVEVSAAAPPCADARPGHYVNLCVRDTGTGIAPAVRDRLFDPFVTTKATGKGTGLGLATVAGIVRQFGGFIVVESEPGRGSAFHIHLPAYDGPPPTPRGLSVPGNAASALTILLAEDDDTLRTLMTVVLETAGHRVIPAAHGGEALLQLRGESTPINLLLTDLAMPVLGGADLAREARAMRPDVPVAFTSALANEADLIGKDGRRAELLAKPFAPAELLRFVARVASR